MGTISLAPIHVLPYRNAKFKKKLGIIDIKLGFVYVPVEEPEWIYHQSRANPSHREDSEQYIACFLPLDVLHHFGHF
jgi:hypothetical protein